MFSSVRAPLTRTLIETTPVHKSVSLSGLTTVAGSGRQAGPETWSHCCAHEHAAYCCAYCMCKMLVTNKYAICCMDWLVVGTPSQHGCIDCTWCMQMAGQSSSIFEKNRNHALSVFKQTVTHVAHVTARNCISFGRATKAVGFSSCKQTC